MEQNLCIDFLNNKKEFIPVIAESLYNEWTSEYKIFDIDGISQTEQELNNVYCNYDKYPIAFVASIDGEFVCTASISHTDVPKNHPYGKVGPWLIGVYTNKKFRGHGYATKIVDHAIKFARQQLQLPWIWLWTSDMERFYEKYFGFILVEKSKLNGHDINIMRKDLADTKDLFYDKQI